MSRVLPALLAAASLLVFATAATGGSPRLEGTVAAKFPENHLIRVDQRRTAYILRVPGSQVRIRVGQRVELSGTTLRQRGNGSRVLARDVVVAGSASTSSPRPSGDDTGRDDDSTDDSTDDATDDDTTDDDSTENDDHGNRGHGGGGDDD